MLSPAAANYTAKNDTLASDGIFFYESYLTALQIFPRASTFSFIHVNVTSSMVDKTKKQHLRPDTLKHIII